MRRNTCEQAGAGLSIGKRCKQFVRVKDMRKCGPTSRERGERRHRPRCCCHRWRIDTYARGERYCRISDALHEELSHNEMILLMTPQADFARAITVCSLISRTTFSLAGGSSTSIARVSGTLLHDKTRQENESKNSTQAILTLKFGHELADLTEEKGDDEVRCSEVARHADERVVAVEDDVNAEVCE